MNRKFVEQWLNDLREYWLNKDIINAVSLFNKTTFYQETPFMKPFLTIEEIKEEWQHVKNEQIHKIEMKILALDGNTMIVTWYLEQNNDVDDGIYYI